MIVLNSTMKLQAFTTNAPSTALQFHLHYVDYSSTFAYDNVVPSIGTFNQTETDIVGLVDSGKLRAVKDISIYNASNGSQEVNIVIDVAGVNYPKFKLNVNAGCFLYYNDGKWTESKTAVIGTDLLTLSARSSNPALPGADTLLLYDLPIAGRQIPRFIGSSGLDSAIQPALFGNGIILIAPNTTTTFFSMGTVAPTIVGTLSHPALTANNLRESTRRGQVLSASTAGSASEVRIAYASVWRGNGAGLGGFFFRCRFAFGPIVNTQRLAVGLWSATGATTTTIEPSTLTNCIFVGNDLADSNLQIMYNDASGSCTKVDTGIPKNVLNEIFDITFFCGSNSNQIGWTITKLNDGTTVSGTISDANMPPATTFLAPHAYLNNGGTASAVTLDILRIYIETDQ